MSRSEMHSCSWDSLSRFTSADPIYWAWCIYFASEDFRMTKCLQMCVIWVECVGFQAASFVCIIWKNGRHESCIACEYAAVCFIFYCGNLVGVCLCGPASFFGGLARAWYNLKWLAWCLLNPTIDEISPALACVNLHWIAGLNETLGTCAHRYLRRDEK